MEESPNSFFPVEDPKIPAQRKGRMLVLLSHRSSCFSPAPSLATSHMQQVPESCNTLCLVPFPRLFFLPGHSLCPSSYAHLPGQSLVYPCHLAVTPIPPRHFPCVPQPSSDLLICDNRAGGLILFISQGLLFLHPKL